MTKKGLLAQCVTRFGLLQRRSIILCHEILFSSQTFLSLRQEKSLLVSFPICFHFPAWMMASAETRSLKLLSFQFVTELGDEQQDMNSEDFLMHQQHCIAWKNLIPTLYFDFHEKMPQISLISFRFRSTYITIITITNCTHCNK